MKLRFSWLYLKLFHSISLNIVKVNQLLSKTSKIGCSLRNALGPGPIGRWFDSRHWLFFLSSYCSASIAANDWALILCLFSLFWLISHVELLKTSLTCSKSKKWKFHWNFMIFPMYLFYIMKISWNFKSQIKSREIAQHY